MADAPPGSAQSAARPDPAPVGRARPSSLRLLLFCAVLTFVGYVVFNAVGGLVDAGRLDASVVAVREEIDDLKWQAEQLAVLAAYLDSDEYVERVAREDLGLVRPGEEAFAVEAPRRPGLPILRTPWWANLLPAPTDVSSE